jgi:SanA protein
VTIIRLMDHEERGRPAGQVEIPQQSPRRSCLRRGCALLVLLALLAAFFPFLWREALELRYRGQITSAAEAPERRVAIVFGAAVYAGGRLSPMLRDRAETAVQLYHAGKVEQLLLSGDNSSPEYNEPWHMMAYAISRGVPEEAIQPDYGGRRTYDSCYRARHVFLVEEAILVTQEFHLPRAVFTCETLGVSASGVIADMREYHPRSIGWSESREVAALLRALYDVVLERPAAVMGEPIPLR